MSFCRNHSKLTNAPTICLIPRSRPTEKCSTSAPKNITALKYSIQKSTGNGPVRNPNSNQEHHEGHGHHHEGAKSSCEETSETHHLIFLFELRKYRPLFSHEKCSRYAFVGDPAEDMSGVATLPRFVPLAGFVDELEISNDILLRKILLFSSLDNRMAPLLIRRSNVLSNLYGYNGAASSARSQNACCGRKKVIARSVGRWLAGRGASRVKFRVKFRPICWSEWREKPEISPLTPNFFLKYNMFAQLQ